jgi:hypothetical protein
MSRIPLLLGFFLPMLVTVTADHLVKQPGVGEVIDSIITALFFTAAFAVGAGFRNWLTRKEPPARAFLRGSLAGLVVQAAVWGFWLSVPEAVRYTFGMWPLVGHVLLSTLAGYAASRVRLPGTNGA